VKEQFGVEPTLIEGSGGIFDVVVDGERIYCRQETGRFPTNDEIIGALRERG
jgi:predicted Rdx family selenoprotein